MHKKSTVVEDRSESERPTNENGVFGAFNMYLQDFSDDGGHL